MMLWKIANQLRLEHIMYVHSICALFFKESSVDANKVYWVGRGRWEGRRGMEMVDCHGTDLPRRYTLPLFLVHHQDHRHEVGRRGLEEGKGMM